MVVEHIVLAKLERELTGAEKAKMRAKLLEIPGVINVTAGTNYTSRGLEYNTGIIVRLASAEAEKAYQTHPVHVEVRDTILKPLIIKGTETTPPVLAVDYECTPVKQLDWMSVAVGVTAGVLVGVMLAKMR